MVFDGIAVVVALAVAGWFGRLGFLAVSAKDWPEVPGKIVSSAVEPQPGGWCRARINYVYRVGSKELTGETVCFGKFIEVKAAATEQVLAWPVGKEVGVRHHPGRPQLSCLEPRADQRVWLFFGGALMLAGVMLMSLAR